MSGAIELDGVWKSYPRWSGHGRTLKGLVSQRMPVLMRQKDRRWVLKDVTLDIQPGESVGLIGANGAGKSTLLRLAAGVGRPDRGHARLPENTASVLNFDSWFDYNLTGRENAVTALMIGGWRAKQARGLLPAVLEFAELEAFADAPVRTYSEGMKLRLAFGVVAQLEPEALLLDEVISVGDIRFEAKCMERIGELRERGATLLLASHGLDQVEDECDRAVWLQAGGVRAAGDSHAVVEEYRGAMQSDTLDRTPAPSSAEGSALELRRNRFGSQEMRIESVVLRNPEGSEVSSIPSGGSLLVDLELRGGSDGTPVPASVLTVTLHRVSDGVIVFEASSDHDGARVPAGEQSARAMLDFHRLDLLPGEYAIDVGAYPPGWDYAYDFHWQAYLLTVTGVAGSNGVFRPPHAWEMRAGD